MPIFAWIILALAVVGGLSGMLSYNRLVAMRQGCARTFANVDVQLKRRRDLVPNLVETVRGYASHERSTFDAVTQARNAAMAAKGVPAIAAAEAALSGALGQLFAVAEAYPDLKASSNFQQLQAELANIERQIADARNAFNNMVQQNNTMVQQFPMSLIAGPLGFGTHAFFNVGDDRKAIEQKPEVKF